jgi:hypothetical protein
MQYICSYPPYLEAVSNLQPEDVPCHGGREPTYNGYGLVVGSCEHSDKPSCSGTTQLVGIIHARLCDHKILYQPLKENIKYLWHDLHKKRTWKQNSALYRGGTSMHCVLMVVKRIPHNRLMNISAKTGNNNMFIDLSVYWQLLNSLQVGQKSVTASQPACHSFSFDNIVQHLYFSYQFT